MQILLMVCALMALSCEMRGESLVSSGTGFYLNQTTVITCAHVITGSQSIEVTDARGIKKVATVISQDPSVDLALLRVMGTAPGVLQVAPPNSAVVMDPIMVVGFPLANALGTEISASEGRINAIRRSVMGATIQIDAVINSGNSGGPVVNSSGQVVGIAVAKMESARAMGREGGTERLNFAVPAETITAFILKNNMNLVSSSQGFRAKTPQEIFQRTKEATVMVCANTIKGNQARPVGGAISLKEANERKRVQRWCEDFIVTMDGGSIEKEASFYGALVDYQGRGSVDRNGVAQIVSARRKAWPRRQLTLMECGILQRSEVADNIGVSMKVFSTLSGPNNTKSNGITQIMVLLNKFSKSPEIVCYREKQLD